MDEFEYDDYEQMMKEMCGEDAWAAYLEHEARESAIVRTRERRRCFTCTPCIGRVRRVTGHFITNQRQDPTQAYKLACGHSTIDV